MVYVDCALHFPILVYYLIIIGYAADAIRPFPPRCQFGGMFGRGGEGEDKAAELVGVSGWWSRRSGHLLVSESEPLLYGLDVCGGVFSGWRRIGIHVEAWRKRWFAACCNHEGRESVGHCVEGQHDPRYFINPCFGRRSFEQAGAEHVVEGPMAPFIDGIAFRMVGGSENLLDPEGAQQLGPDSADKLPASVGEECRSMGSRGT